MPRKQKRQKPKIIPPDNISAVYIARDYLFARLDFPENGTPRDRRNADECLFPRFLYRIEAIEQTGIGKVYTETKDGRMFPRTQRGSEWDNASVKIALKGVKYWWPETMFSFFDAYGNPFDVRLMRLSMKADKQKFYENRNEN